MTSPTGDRTVRAADAGGDGKITRDVVLTAALEIIDCDGAEALSMRRLASALNRDPMIIYRHAPNKAALLDGVAETVLAQLKVDPADPDWAAQFRAIARGHEARSELRGDNGAADQKRCERTNDGFDFG